MQSECNQHAISMQSAALDHDEGTLAHQPQRFLECFPMSVLHLGSRTRSLSLEVRRDGELALRAPQQPCTPVPLEHHGGTELELRCSQALSLALTLDAAAEPQEEPPGHTIAVQPLDESRRVGQALEVQELGECMQQRRIDLGAIEESLEGAVLPSLARTWLAMREAISMQ